MRSVFIVEPGKEINLMVKKQFLLSIAILKHKNHAISTGAIQELKERLLALKIQVTFINYSIEPDNPIYLSKAINQLLPGFTKECNFFALTNVFPDLEDEQFKELVQFHLQHQNQFVYYADHEAMVSLSEKRYWISMKSRLWWETGGFCPFLGFPDNFFSEIVERSICKGNNRSDFKLKIEHSKYFPIYTEEPVKLIQRDEEYFNHIYTYQNYLKLKKPDFIVIGAQKSSSTSIIHTLSLHPEVFAPKAWLPDGNYITNEVHFFNTNKFKDLGLDWYYSLFYHPAKKVSGEKTPDYIDDRLFIERIKKYCPNTKLIVSIRNPVHRAWSAIQHMRRKNNHWGLQIMKQGTAEEAYELLGKEHLDDSIIKKGCYFNQLEYLFKLFPKEQVKIIIHERMHEKYEETYRDLFLFLGIDPDVKIPKVHLNSGYYTDNRSEASKQVLQDYYQPYNEKLFKLLGHDIPEWSST